MLTCAADRTQLFDLAYAAVFGEHSRSTATCVAPRAWIRHLAPITWRVPHQINFPRSHGPILASREDGGRLGNYGDPGAAMSPKGFVGRLASPAFGSMVDCATSARTKTPSLAAARQIIQVCDYSL